MLRYAQIVTDMYTYKSVLCNTSLHETPVISSGRRDEMVGDVAASIPSLLTGKSADAFHAGKTIYPTHWTSTSTANYDGFQIVPVSFILIVSNILNCTKNQ